MLVDVVRIQGTRFEERQGSFDCAAARFARGCFAQDDTRVTVNFGGSKKPGPESVPASVGWLPG